MHDPQYATENVVPLTPADLDGLRDVIPHAYLIWMDPPTVEPEQTEDATEP